MQSDLLRLPLLLFACALPASVHAQQVEVAGRKCATVASSLVPPLSAILDSAGAAAALRAALPERTQGQAIITVSYGATGQAGQARLLASDLPDSLGAVVLQTVAGELRDVPANGYPGARLFLDLDAAVTLKAEPPTYCPPARLDDGTANREVITVTANQPGPQRIKPPTIRFMVGGEGAIESLAVEVSSGSSEFDDARANLIRRRRYQPALVDGVPVSVWLREP